MSDFLMYLLLSFFVSFLYWQSPLALEIDKHGANRERLTIASKEEKREFLEEEIKQADDEKQDLKQELRSLD